MTVHDADLARILGWTPANTDCGHGWTDTAGRERGHGPDVDDLIRWLADRRWFPYELYPDPFFTLEQFDVWVATMPNYSDDDTRQFNVTGATLRDALSDAVIRVHEGNTP